MKRCNNCERDYDSNRSYCVICGEKLSDISSSFNNQVHESNVQPQENISQNNSNSQNSLWNCWRVYIFSFVGIMIWWNFYEWLGLALCYVAVKYALDSKNSFKITISILVALIATALSIIIACNN